jgi:hypothetical protein
VLTLTLRHVPAANAADETLLPRTTVFAQPTIADPLPASGAARPVDPRSVFELREDAWRQIELMSEEAFARAEAEFAPIERVVNEARVAGGYARVHARHDAREPLDGVQISIDGLRPVFKRVVQEWTTVAFVGREHAIDGGFAFRTAGDLVVYGTARDGCIECIGLRPSRERRRPLFDAPALAQLRRTHALVLVDWCARTAVRPGARRGELS